MKKWSFLSAMSALFLISSLIYGNDLEVKKIQVNEVELAYYIRGEGKPLLMINGYKSTLASWDPALLSELEKSHQLILFDNRGVGFSSDTKEDHTTIEQMADDAAGLIKALNFERAHVLGWSMGARIAQQVIIRHPEVVDKLILCAPNPGGTHQAKTLEEVTKKLNSPTLSQEESIALFFSASPQGIKEAHQYLERVKNAVANQTIPDDFQVKPETVERQNRARGGTWDTSNQNYEALIKIKVPVLLTDGKNDLIDLPGNVKIMAERIPFAWVAYFDGGHAYLFQEHKRFAELVKIFLND